MFRFSRKMKVIAAFIIIMAAGYGVLAFWSGKDPVPQDFTSARNQGATIAQNIVQLSNESTADLAKVNELDKQGNYAEALKLTNAIIARSGDLRNHAVALSAQVGAMTKALSGVASFDAQQAALQSISSRLALINQLITYSGDLDKLLGALNGKFSGVPQQRGVVQGLVNQINTDVNAINNFNLQATQAMQQFDNIVKG